LVFTVPSVEYKVKLRKHRTENQEENTDYEKLLTINSPIDLPDPSAIEAILEPYVKLEIITTAPYIGNIMEYMSKKRSIYKSTDYLEAERAVLVYETPLQEVITNLHDAIKTASKGYASINYELLDFRVSELVKLDIIIAGEIKEELSRIVPKEKARSIGIKILEKLKNTLPRQNFTIALQAAINGNVIARQNISALKKDVLAKLYGGDRTRKDKLLKKQKKGKKKMQELGRVNIPTKAYVEIMKS
jgi:GTP-binding protein LepA